MKLLDVDYSLFDAVELQQTWQLLLDRDLVAWECVASKDECALALGKCAKRRSLPPFLSRYIPSDSELVEFEARFTAIELGAVPDVLADPIRRLAEQQ